MIADDLRGALEARARREIRVWAAGVDEPVEVQAATGRFLKLSPGEMPRERDRFRQIFGDRVVFETRRAPAAGVRTEAPVKIRFSGLADLADCTMSEEWRLASSRILALRAEAGRLDALLGAIPRILDLDERDFETLLTFIRWRRGDPEARPHVRSVALEGTDGKWIERNLSLCQAAAADLGFPGNASDPFAACGLVREDRLEVLISWNPESFPSPFGNRSMKVRLAEIASSAAIAERVRTCIVVENIEIFERISPAPGVLCLFGAGHAAGAILRGLSCLSEIPILYWGDMDSHGFQCLAEVRRVRPDCASFRMGTEMLTLAMAMGSREPEASRLEGVPEELGADEAAACAEMKRRRLRFEQEHDGEGLAALTATGLAVSELDRAAGP
jgi:hypothetical protein